jgi:adenylate cyclase
MLGLDGVKVFTRDAGTGWKQASSRPKDFDHSDTILDKVLAERRTFRLVPEHDLGSGRPVSLDNVKSVVAAPILDRDGEVIGALYGDRRTVRENRLEITEIEAVLAEMVACGIAAGIARVNEEQDALKARAQFESFFTPELARQLELEPDLLDGREAEITVMFCDVRGFSRISHRIGPRETVAWTSDVMARLSDCVSAHGGVLVDYIGDELMAMWGAPQQTPRHAELACRAGLEMLRTLPEINRLWKERIGDATAIGIGVNSGKAFVGNTGSHRKFKYGPLGNTVNLASRVQGATRQVNSAMLITDMTHTALTGQQSGGDLRTRRLCQARVVNISEPVQLYEVDAGDRPRWDELRTLYEEALAMFEAGDFAKSARILGNLMADHPEDGPTLRLLARAVNALATGPDPSHPVWEFDSK